MAQVLTLCRAPGASCTIIASPGARGLILWPTSEVRGAWLTVLGLSFDSPGYIDEVAPKWSRFCVLDIHYFTPRTSRLSPITSHYERQPVSPSARRPVGPSARRNERLLWQICRFLRYPKLGAVGVDGFGAPVNDNHYRYRLQTGTSMIIVVIYIYKPKWEWLSIVLVNENDYHYPMANDN